MPAGPPDQGAPAGHPIGAEPAKGQRKDWWWVPGATTVVVILGVIAVTLWQLHLNLLFSNTTTTGGDTGSHLALPAYLQTLLKHGHLSGWDPGWYDGFPLYTFYFVLPDLFAAIGGWIIPFNIAFKWVTVLGSLLLPITAWACGRLFRLRPPIPAVMAAMTLPFLFDYTFTIYGGNLFSTMAGEYAYSFSLSLALLFLGLFSRSVRDGSCRIWSAIALAGCLLAHIVPAMYALVGAAILTLVELAPQSWGIGDGPVRVLFRTVAPSEPGSRTPTRWRMLWWSASTVGLGLLLAGFWLVPFGIRQPYATSMGYQNLSNFWSLLFPEADAWALAIAGLGVVAAVLLRSRFALTLTTLGGISALGLVFDPQGSLYNVRLLPLWILSFYLMVAWVFGVAAIAVAEWWRRWRRRRWDEAAAAPEWAEDPPPVRPWEPAPSVAQSATELTRALKPRKEPSYRFGAASISGAVIGLLGVLAVVTPPFFLPASALPLTPGANQVTNWSAYNYSGYQAQPAYPEYRALYETMKRIGHTDGCGRAMWEYSASEDRFGTPEALMLLPYWTDGCIDSMEGLLFESSATTPYHFIDQAELSAGPSDPEVGLPYGPLNVTLGVQHLQLLGVRYFIAETAEVEDEAAADPELSLVASTGPWVEDYDGAPLTTTWKIYRVHNAPLVSPLANDPLVLKGIHPAPSSWLNPSLAWYDDPTRWNVELAQSGPPSWPRASISDLDPATVHTRRTSVSHIALSDSSISFDVSKVGSPVLVKISYFPNWHASGATGPWRVTPNLMVVVPTSHHVVLTYGTSRANQLGDAGTVVAIVVIVVAAGGVLRRRTRRKPAHAR